MIEYYTSKKIDNSRLVLATSPSGLRAMWKRAAAGGVIALCVWFYAWQHFECIQVRYQIEQLNAQRTQVEELNQQLHLEVATLEAPTRVDSIARTQLGLTMPVPAEVAPASAMTGDTVLADARTSAFASRP
jgi:cell division protein FtsL